MAIKRYIIVQAEEYDFGRCAARLAELVNEQIAKGYVVGAGLAITRESVDMLGGERYILVQAMIYSGEGREDES